MIAIVDYDIGNISAISNMFHRLGIKSIITSKKSDLELADKIILPGNGAFDACIKNLRLSGLLPILESRVLGDKVPLLGICVGAQMLGHRSEEGNESGLGWINMSVKKFPSSLNIRVPHMGWNYVNVVSKGHPLTIEMNQETRFYFIHSYYMAPENDEDILLNCNYGLSFAAAITSGNIIGVQFHPEKSHKFGKELLSKFGRDF